MRRNIEKLIDSVAKLWHNLAIVNRIKEDIMQIVPIRDLKNTNKIYEQANSAQEPIFVTKNGYGALVVMSMETYARNFAATEVRRLLKEAEDEVAAGIPDLDGFQVLEDLRAKYVK